MTKTLISARPHFRRFGWVVAAIWASALGGSLSPAAAQSNLVPALTAPAADAPNTGGPIRLRQQAPGTGSADAAAVPQQAVVVTAPERRYVQGEFERYVATQAGADVRVQRFGAELVSDALEGASLELSPQVPNEYVIATGDEVLLTLWGSVEADLRLLVDRGGRITIPRVGTVQVSGVSYGELQDVVSRRVAQVFKNFQLSVSLGQLRAVRVFVTGFVQRPGTYTVNSLSTVVTALMKAGGPAASGSFRSIELRRHSQLLASFDLYDLLLKGDRSADRIVQAGDVVHVGPVGIQVGFLGSVNKPTVLELKSGETVTDALRVAGGFSAIADRSRLAVERLQERNAGRVQQLTLPRDLASTLNHGDLVRAFSAVDAVLPGQQQSKRVRIEGEVARPAEYVLPPNSSVADALRAAGGVTSNAFLYATQFNRESVRQTQQENYDRALRDLETDFARLSTRRSQTADEAAGEASRTAATTRLLERLRTLRPNGRIVLQMTPNSTELPDLALEDGDRLYIPPKSTTVGVFGSVFNAASYLHSSTRTLDQYLQLAGGATKGADESSVFVVRANGNVLSNRQAQSSWFRRVNVLQTTTAEPGDTIFVPEELDKITFLQAAKDWTQILYQFGIGTAGIMSAFR